MLKPAKKDRKEVLSVRDKKVDELHMRTKCPKQPRDFLGKEDHQYAPCLEIKPRPKNAWPSLENPLAHPKCVNHMRPKCNLKEFVCPKKSWMDSLHFNTRVNWVKRWSKTCVISFIGLTMWMSSTKEGKMQLGACKMVFRRAQ
jgi:hypothetical protein